MPYANTTLLGREESRRSSGTPGSSPRCETIVQQWHKRHSQAPSNTTHLPTYLPTYLPTHLPTQKGARPTPFRSGDALGEPPSEGSDINTLDKKVFFLETIWETQLRTIVSLEQLCWKFLFSGKSGFQGSKKVDDGKINWNTTW